MKMSPTSDETMLPKAAPMMTPTARSKALPLTANSWNFFSMALLPDGLAAQLAFKRLKLL